MEADLALLLERFNLCFLLREPPELDVAKGFVIELEVLII
jgi:hypothetical protein